jgi:tetratricopeptide (TPR) repeat protein
MSAPARANQFRQTLLAAASAVVALLAPFVCEVGRAAVARQSVPPARVAQVVEQARSAPLADDAYAQALALGYALFNEGRYSEAAELFGALVARKPRDSSALYGAALATFNAGRAAEAEPLARRAVESAQENAARTRAGDGARQLNARTSDALVLLAVVLAVRGDDAGALKSARDAAALAPESFDAQFTLGRALYGAGDAPSAARAFRSAVALKPEDTRARFFLATSLEQAGDDAGALAAYRELISQQPQAAEGHLGLGIILVKRGGVEAEEGLKELSRAIELNPDLYEARVAVGRALVARGRAAEAVEHLRRAAELAPGNPEPHYQLSIAYRRLGRKVDADAESEIVKRIHESRRATPATQGMPRGAQTP